MKMTVEGMVNTVNACRFTVAVFWTTLMLVTVSNASYGVGNVEWGLLLICVIVEAVVTYGIKNMYYQYGADKAYERGSDGYGLDWKYGIGIAIEDIRAAKFVRVYFGLFATLWSFICFVVCGCIWIFL